ncbi:MAG: TetR/AcrR family transcriptional regulator [Actinomycetota bacterium]|nr:TetR/AcrR family transcriptional regulator [Actinomycetota bacterium]MDA2971434.1 TetR/AcrR family transcriptional regulator [Actinomycetota bacterium]MDA3002333.1 TetR/AcrR family transcriptional regulator [Actinomycetota bacterium]
MTVAEGSVSRRRSAAETKRIVLDAARRRIENEGAVSLKISDIVRDTKIADVIIYRHFGDRRGVIIEALCEFWLEFTRANLDEARRVVHQAPPRGVTGSLMAPLMVRPEDPVYRRRRWLRIQTLAAAQEFPELLERIAVEQRLANDELEDLLEEIRIKNGRGPLPAPVESIRAAMLGSTIGYVLDDAAGPSLTDEMQIRFWSHFFVSMGLAVPD